MKFADIFLLLCARVLGLSSYESDFHNAVQSNQGDPNPNPNPNPDLNKGTLLLEHAIALLSPNSASIMS